MTTPLPGKDMSEQTDAMNREIQNRHLSEQRVVDLIASVNHSTMRFKTGELVFDPSSEGSENSSED